MLELLCVAHRIITPDQRPRRHSGDRTSPIPIATGELSTPPLAPVTDPVPHRFLRFLSLGDSSQVVS
jgi:hypothetical protein